MIGNFRKTKSEQKRDLKEKMRNEDKEKRYHGPKEKGGGTNNKQKLKMKPLAMVRPKKNKSESYLNSLSKRIKEIKNKLTTIKHGKYVIFFEM